MTYSQRIMRHARNAGGPWGVPFMLERCGLGGTSQGRANAFETAIDNLVLKGELEYIGDRVGPTFDIPRPERVPLPAEAWQRRREAFLKLVAVGLR